MRVVPGVPTVIKLPLRTLPRILIVLYHSLIPSSFFPPYSIMSAQPSLEVKPEPTLEVDYMADAPADSDYESTYVPPRTSRCPVRC